MTASDILTKICSEDLAGVNLLSSLYDPANDDFESQILFKYSENAHVNIQSEAAHVIVNVTLEDDRDFEDMLDALSQINSYPLGSNGKELLNVITLVPSELDSNIIAYASGYLGLYSANQDTLTIQFLFPKDEFQVFSLDAEKLDEIEPDELDKRLEEEGQEYHSKA